MSPEIKLAARLIPWLGEAFAKYTDDVIERRRAKLRALEEEFTSASGEEIDRVFERSARDPRFGDLVAETLDAAQRTASDQKVRAFGRLLALGFEGADPPHLDEIELMFLALADLEAAHIRVLDMLVRRATRYKGIADYEIARLFPNGTTISYPILKTLERHGLAGPQSPATADPDSPVLWAPWDFGLFVHKELLTGESG